MNFIKPTIEIKYNQIRLNKYKGVVVNINVTDYCIRKLMMKIHHYPPDSFNQLHQKESVKQFVMETSQPINKTRNRNWLKKIGITGFLFFLIKGIAWIAVTYLVIR